MQCPYHPVSDYDALKESAEGGYSIVWKAHNKYYDDHGIFPDSVCDMLEDAKPFTRVFIEGKGCVTRPCDANLEHYEMIRHNKMALMVWLDVFGDEPPRLNNDVDKDSVKEAVLLHRVVEAYAPWIRQIGQQRYQARCPFHEDRVASVSIDDKKGLWHCFAGCGSGDIFSFIMKAENCTFKEAVSRAERYI